jgi:hypothetical protein
MPVCRLIFRLDFTVNFDVIEHSGEVMRTLWNAFESERNSGFELKENQRNRTIILRYLSENGDFIKHLNVEPTSINGAFESTEGVEIDKLLNDQKGFLFLTKLASQLCEQFRIDTILRSGLRLFYFNKLGSQEGNDVVRAFHKMLNADTISTLETRLGTIQDYGIVLDGTFDDGVRYHFGTGPYRSEEAQKYFAEIAGNFSQQTDFDFTCDLDLYENNFSLSSRQLSKMYRPVVAKASEIIQATESEVLKILEGS